MSHSDACVRAAGARFMTIAMLCLLAAPAAAQDLPSPEAMARSTQALVDELSRLQAIPQPGETDKKELAKANAQVAELVRSMQGDGYSREHYVEVSSVLIQDQSQAAIDIAESGLRRYPDARFLYDHVGFAATSLALHQSPSAQQLVQLQAAEAAFKKALALEPDTEHTHIGLYQVLDHLDRPDEALGELAAALKFPEAQQQLNFLWLRRAGLLLRAGKVEDALAVLQSGEVPADDLPMQRIFVLRAYALSGDVAKAQQQIATMLAADETAAATAAAVDALLYLNKKADALKLLQQRPPHGDDAAQQKQSFAAFEAIAKNSDLAAASARAALTKALDHHFLVMDADKRGKPRQLDFSNSPVMLAQLLAQALAEAGEETQKGWANHILLALCLRAQKGYKAPADEAKFAALLQNSMHFPDAEDLPAVLLALRLGISDPQAQGPLQALRTWEKLGDKKPGKK